MNAINGLLRPLFDGLLWPFRGLGPWTGLVAVSLLTAVAMLLVFRATSNQRRIKAIKRQIHACLFEMRLFNDDLRAIVRAQFEILRHNFFYLLHSSVPVVFMIVPLVLTIAHLQAYYGYRAPTAGDRLLLTAVLKDDRQGFSGERPTASLTLPQGVVSEDEEATWLPSLGELVWRLRVEEPGMHVVTLRVDDREISKSLDAAAGARARSPVRRAAGIWDQLLYPREAPIPADVAESVTEVEIDLAPATVPFFGLGLPWLVPYFVLSMAFAWGLRKRFGVTL